MPRLPPSTTKTRCVGWGASCGPSTLSSGRAVADWPRPGRPCRPNRGPLSKSPEERLGRMPRTYAARHRLPATQEGPGLTANRGLVEGLGSQGCPLPSSCSDQNLNFVVPFVQFREVLVELDPNGIVLDPLQHSGVAFLRPQWRILNAPDFGVPHGPLQGVAKNPHG